MKQSEKTPYRTLAAYVEGEMGESKAAALDSALSDSAEDQRRLDRIRGAIAALREPPETADLDLLPRLMPYLDANHPPLSAPRGSRRVSARHLGIAAAAAAVILLPVALFLNSQGPSSFAGDAVRAKSATVHDTRSRWIAFNAFRLKGDATAEPLRNTLHTNDGLVFSYTNLGPDPFSYLMIFGVDGSGRVYWYYPAFLDAADNPKSIRANNGVSREELEEVIAHPYAEGSLTLFALFSDTAIMVSDIETAVARGAKEAPSLEAKFSGARVKAFSVEVVE